MKNQADRHAILFSCPEYSCLFPISDFQFGSLGISPSSFVLRHSFVIGYFVIRHSHCILFFLPKIFLPIF